MQISNSQNANSTRWRIPYPSTVGLVTDELDRVTVNRQQNTALHHITMQQNVIEYTTEPVSYQLMDTNKWIVFPGKYSK